MQIWTAVWMLCSQSSIGYNWKGRVDPIWGNVSPPSHEYLCWGLLISHAVVYFLITGAIEEGGLWRRAYIMESLYL